MQNFNKNKKTKWIILGIIVAMLIGFLKVQSDLSPVAKGKSDTFVIEEGESFDSVLEHLEKEGFIKSAFVTKYYSKFFGTGKYYAGYFELKDTMSTSEILEFISNQSNAKAETVTLTFPEGKWTKEIAEILAENFDYTKEEIIEKWNDIDYIKELAKDYEFLDVKVLNNKEYNVKLEGYLFPNTYQFDKNADLDTITRTFLDQFKVVYDQYKDEIEKSDMSLHEIITFASIVQFESGSADEMKTVAGVFYNRMDKGMRLGSSVTVCYALYDEFESAEDCETNAEIDSPYNTYLHTGLPIGPILNPGKEAIEAVLEPEDNDYLYFVADIYHKKDGKMHFSKTYEEHEKWIEELGLNLDNSEETDEHAES